MGVTFIWNYYYYNYCVIMASHHMEYGYRILSQCCASYKELKDHYSYFVTTNQLYCISTIIWDCKGKSTEWSVFYKTHKNELHDCKPSYKEPATQGLSRWYLDSVGVRIICILCFMLDCVHVYVFRYFLIRNEVIQFSTLCALMFKVWFH